MSKYAERAEAQRLETNRLSAEEAQRIYNETRSMNLLRTPLYGGLAHKPKKLPISKYAKRMAVPFTQKAAELAVLLAARDAYALPEAA